MYFNFDKVIGLLLFFSLCTAKTAHTVEPVTQKMNTPIANALVNRTSNQSINADVVNIREINFIAQPAQCVTLHQGRDCFTTITLQWRTQIKQDICLYQNDNNEQLKCWKNSNSAKHTIEFESNESINYQLRIPQNNQLIAQAQVTVSWLHKKHSRKRRWRLF